MPAPEILGQSWLNSEPLRLAQHRDKVILVEFWTFGCYNCRNVEPHIKTWHRRYAEKGLVVIVVHSAEFSYERVLANVQRYVREHAIGYPVAIDNNFSTMAIATGRLCILSISEESFVIYESEKGVT